MCLKGARLDKDSRPLLQKLPSKTPHYANVSMLNLTTYSYGTTYSLVKNGWRDPLIQWATPSQGTPGSVSLPPLILSGLLLNGCPHCSLSLRHYLHLTVFCQGEVPGRQSGGDIPDPLVIIVEWRPKPCLPLSLCLGYAGG